MKKLLILLLILLMVIFTLIACEVLIPGGALLSGTQWRLSAWLDDSLGPSQFTITAHFDESTIFGTSAINSYSGSYVATTSHNFSVSDLQMTLMGGSEEAMQAESIYFQLLQEACQYTLNQTNLILFDALGNELLIFSKMVSMAGLVTIEEIDILIAESHPVQVFVVIKGYLPDTCTDIGQIIQAREGNAFLITIKNHCSQEICSDVIVPFTETISLQVYGLPAGNYTVDVNGVKGSFILEIDNIFLPDW